MYSSMSTSPSSPPSSPTTPASSSSPDSTPEPRRSSTRVRGRPKRAAATTSSSRRDAVKKAHNEDVTMEEEEGEDCAKGRADDDDGVSAKGPKIEGTSPPPPPPAPVPAAAASKTVNPLMLPPHEIDLVRGQHVVLQSIPYLPANQRAIIEGYDQKTCKYRVTLVKQQSTTSQSSPSVNDTTRQGSSSCIPSNGNTSQWAVFRENIRIVPPYHMPSRHPFPSRHCLQLQFSGTALDYAKHDGEGGGSIGIGDSILASINGGRLYTLVNVEECQRLDVGGEVKKAMNDAAAAASSTYALVLSYPPDSEAKHLQKECDITSVLSPGEAHINGDWMLFRPGDKVYAPSSIDNGRFLPAVIAEDHRTGEPTEAHETLPVAFTRGGGGKKIERVPRSFIFRRSSMQDEGDQSSVSPGAEKKRGTKRGVGGEKGEGQGVACRKHRKVATSTSDQLEASDSPGHKKVPLLEELGLYDDDEEKGEGSSTRMTDEEWKVVEKSLHILRRFGIDALVNSEKREVFPVPSTQKVDSEEWNSPSDLRRWVEQRSPWPRKKEMSDTDILRKLTGIEAHECSSFWMVDQEKCVKEEQ